MRFSLRQSGAEERGPTAIRKAALIPLVLSAFAFFLTILVMTAGRNTTTLPGLAVFTLNTSRAGESILQEINAEIRAIHLTRLPPLTGSDRPSATSDPAMQMRSSAETSAHDSPGLLQPGGLAAKLLGHIGGAVDTATSAAANATASAAGLVGDTLGGILNTASSGLAAITDKAFSALFAQVHQVIGVVVKRLKRAIAKAVVRFIASEIDDLGEELSNLTAAAAAELTPLLQNATQAAEATLLREVSQLIRNTERSIVTALANETKEVAGAVAANARARLDAVGTSLVSFARNETTDLGAAIASHVGRDFAHAKQEVLVFAANKTADVASAASRKVSEIFQEAQTDAAAFARNGTKRVESAVISKASGALVAARRSVLSDLGSAVGNASDSLGAAARNMTTNTVDATRRDVVSITHIARSVFRNKTLALESTSETSALHALGGLQASIVPTVNRAFSGITNDIELADFYTFYTLGTCSGLYVGDGSNQASAKQKMISCSKYLDIDPLSNLKQAISFGLVSSGMALLTAAYAVIKTPSLVSARMNAFSAGAAAVMISTLASVIGSLSNSTSRLISLYGSPVGVSATAGTGYRVLLWSAAVLMGLSTIVWYVMYIWFERQTKQMLKSMIEERAAAVHISTPVMESREKGWAQTRKWGER
ncbi:hypothetical protein LTR53_000567 [Teratosphaeriaceae sp. CCFEE 6253]|nr:hypothetical protein LTR53_000567 [Teratosphaeriaceae sp. CCFEE 6253]